MGLHFMMERVKEDNTHMSERRERVFKVQSMGYCCRHRTEDNRKPWSRSTSFTSGHMKMRYLFLMAVIACSCSIAACSYESQRQNARSRHLPRHSHRSIKKPTTYLNQIAVNLASPSEELGAALATKYGLIFKGPVVLAERLKVLKRVRRNRLPTLSRGREPFLTKPNDPAWRRMWYMHCGGANNSDCPTSMRIFDAWRAGYAGANVVVTILDDGIETNHPDLRHNYDANASRDINGGDADPTPRYDLSNENKHGTRCAGVVAAVSGNNICSVGIAHKAKIGGIRMLDGEVTDAVEAASLGYNRDHIDVYSASWGPDDDGNTVEGPGAMAKAAFERGARYGRGGKGSIFVWASGNGGHNKDSCACDGYINSIYTIAISSVSQNGHRPWYLESCASTLATTYSSGEINEGKIITTDLRGQCTYQHTGTSASAPMAAGVIALMLEANGNLTWRDVQHIIVRTSNPKGLIETDWVTNGAGYRVSHVFGFGLMDALQLSHVSKNWRTVPEQRRCVNRIDNVRRNITATSAGVGLESDGCRDTPDEINHLEHVLLRITLNHMYRGSLRIFLQSPDGTVSNILERRSLDKSREGFKDWDFMTTHHWGESPQGLWRLRIEDNRPFQTRYRPHRNPSGRNAPLRNPADLNYLVSWQLIFYGTREDPQSNFSLNACDAFPQDQCHEECDGCCGATAMECKSCKHVSTSTGVCIASCSPGYFPHPRTRICQPCWGTCAECSGPHESSCTACKIGFSLIKGRCVQQCSNDAFLDSVTQRCLSCHQSCKTCTGKRDNCTSCINGFQKIGNKCQASCPPSTYIASYQSGCAFCHRHCQECTGPHESQCTECAHGLILHRKRCVRSCPRRSYHDKERSACKLCHKNCKTCKGPSSTDCVSCESGHELREGECRRPCRDEYKGNFSTSPCILIIKMDMCQVDLIRDLCCHSCMMYETGQLFIPTNFTISDDFVTSDMDAENVDYGDDYFAEEYGETMDPLSPYDHVEDYNEGTDELVDGELQFPTRNGDSDSQTPIVIESGLGMEQNRKASLDSPTTADVTTQREDDT